MRFFLSGKTVSQESEVSDTSKVRRREKSAKNRDPLLEEHARALLQPVAPDLCERLHIGWNSRMKTTAGVAIASYGEIWLNPMLKTISPEEVTRTLLHELAHLVASHRHGRRRLAPHGKEWKQACHDLGIPNEARTHHLPLKGYSQQKKYRLLCPACGEGHDRVRLPKRRVACLSCCRLHHGGLYHERFRLEIVRISKKIKEYPQNSVCAEFPQNPIPAA
jgi:predicted SprT family Zn-dependent metalloprotease